jgi:hypothetical protein
MLLPLLSGGCVSLLGKSTDANEPPPPSPATPPCQVVSLWPPEVRLAPDPVHQGQNNPGLVGRVYLFGSDFGWPVTGDGSLVIDLFDETSGQSFLLEEWRFDNGNLKKLLRKDGLGWGYTVFLPWGTYRPEIAKVRLRVAYRPPAPTALPIYAADTPLTLVHPDPALLASTVAAKGPPAPAMPTGPATAKAGFPAPALPTSAPPAAPASSPALPAASVPTVLAPAAPRASWPAPAPAATTPATAWPAPPTSQMTPGMEAAMADLLRTMAQAKPAAPAAPTPVPPVPVSPAPAAPTSAVPTPPAAPETIMPRTMTAPALPSGTLVDLSAANNPGAPRPAPPPVSSATLSDATAQ